MPANIPGVQTAEAHSAMCLVNPPLQLAEFVKDWRSRNRVPLPGDVDIVTGGPPCQGMSGLNRHARTADVLTDSRWVHMTCLYVPTKPSQMYAQGLLPVALLRKA
jgi:hypothetical protein